MELLSIYDAQTEILRWLESLGHKVVYMQEEESCPTCKRALSECYCCEDWCKDMNRRKAEIEAEIADLERLIRSPIEHIVWA